MSYRNRERVHLGAKVDLKSKFEKFEKLSKTGQNDSVVKLSQDRVPNYKIRKEIKETKPGETKKTDQSKNLEKPNSIMERPKLREVGFAKKTSPSSPRSGGSSVLSKRAEERKRNQETANKFKSIEQRMQERKYQKAADQKKKVQGRNAFKQQLEANAPKRDPSAKNALARADTNIDKLFKWVQNRINVYPGIKVEDWNKSWADGKAFCALVQSLEPETFPVDDVDHSGQDRKKNFELAFDFASDMGVPKLLDAEDMASIPVPDSRSIITYVHTIYKVMVHEKREKEKEENEKKGKEDKDENDSAESQSEEEIED